MNRPYSIPPRADGIRPYKKGIRPPMKIQINRAMLIEGQSVEANAVVDCDKTIAKQLIDMGDATLVDALPATADVIEIDTIDKMKEKLLEQANYIEDLEKNHDALEAQLQEVEADNEKLKKAKDELTKKLKAGGTTDAS